MQHTPTSNFLLAEFDNAAITKDVTTCEEKTVRTLHDFQVLKGINRGESVEANAVDRPDPWHCKIIGLSKSSSAMVTSSPDVMLV